MSIKSIGKFKWDDAQDDGCWIMVSAKEGDSFGQIYTVMSFVYIGEKVATEWEPRYGPIQQFEKREKSDPDARPHYTFDYIKEDSVLAWSQMAVEREGLKPAFIRGDYHHIFGVLKKWASYND